MKNTESLFWVKQQFNGVSLKDERLKSRLMSLASNMMANPSASIPKQNGEWKHTKAAYRFFDSNKVTLQELIIPHVNETKQGSRKKKNCVSNPRHNQHILLTL